MDANKPSRDFQTLLTETSKGDNIGDIKTLEALIGVELPLFYRNFLIQYADNRIKEIPLWSIARETFSLFGCADTISIRWKNSKEFDQDIHRNYGSIFMPICNTYHHSIWVCMGYSENWYDKIVLINYEWEQEEDVILLGNSFEEFLYKVVYEYEKSE